VKKKTTKKIKIKQRRKLNEKERVQYLRRAKEQRDREKAQFCSMLKLINFNMDR
jgi:hypothetical protein